MKPKLNPPGTKRLKLNCDILLSSSAVKINLRRYILAPNLAPTTPPILIFGARRQSGKWCVSFAAEPG
jgi:hypothetical protein